MIKNLITASILATSIGIQNTTIIDTTITNTYQNTTLTQSKDEYYEGTLESKEQYATNNYSLAKYGGYYNIQVRTLKHTLRDYSQPEYYYKERTIVKINNQGNIDQTTLKINQYINISKNDEINANYTVAQISKIVETNVYVENFINGATNYYSFDSLDYLNTQIDRLQTTATQNGVLLNGNHYLYNLSEPINDYYLIDYYITFNSTSITDDALYIDNYLGTEKYENQLFYEFPETTGYEVVDIPGMMFAILGMPFAWISTAFNFTIFPNTPYAINISAILMAIVVSLIALYIIKKILK